MDLLQESNGRSGMRVRRQSAFGPAKRPAAKADFRNKRANRAAGMASAGDRRGSKKQATSGAEWAPAAIPTART